MALALPSFWFIWWHLGSGQNAHSFKLTHSAFSLQYFSISSLVTSGGRIVPASDWWSGTSLKCFYPLASDPQCQHIQAKHFGHWIWEQPDSTFDIGTPHFGLGQDFVQCLIYNLFSISSECKFYLRILFISSLSCKFAIKSTLFKVHLLKGWCLSLQSRQNLKSQKVHFPKFCYYSMFAICPQPAMGHQPMSSIWAIALSNESFSYLFCMSSSSFKFLISRSFKLFLQLASGQVNVLIYPSFIF